MSLVSRPETEGETEAPGHTCAFLTVSLVAVSVTVGPLGPQQFKCLAGKEHAFQPQTRHSHPGAMGTYLFPNLGRVYE